MEITIEAYANSYTVKLNGKIISFHTYLEGALETVRKEILARYK